MIPRHHCRQIKMELAALHQTRLPMERAKAAAKIILTACPSHSALRSLPSMSTLLPMLACVAFWMLTAVVCDVCCCTPGMAWCWLRWRRYRTSF